MEDRTVHVLSESQIDRASVQILNMFHPVMNTDYNPLQVIGDGNCLYRSVSLAMSGEQDCHILLRLQTSLELILNRSSYDTKKKYNDFLNDTRIVTSDYDKLVRDAVIDESYAEIVGWGRSFLPVAWPTGVLLLFFFSSGVSKLFGAQGSPSSGSLLNL